MAGLTIFGSSQQSVQCSMLSKFWRRCDVERSSCLGKFFLENLAVSIGKTIWSCQERSGNIFHYLGIPVPVERRSIKAQSTFSIFSGLLLRTLPFLRAEVSTFLMTIKDSIGIDCFLLIGPTCLWFYRCDGEGYVVAEQNRF